MKSVDPKSILVLNAGSSTIKGELLEVGSGSARPLARTSRMIAGAADADGVFKDVLDSLTQVGSKIDAVGHRIVHGGAEFSSAIVVDSSVEKALEELSHLAPLHNPRSLAGIRVTRERFPRTPQVAVFDTAFHADRGPESMRYALPSDLCETHGIRRYGFHGIAHAGLVQSLAAETGAGTDTITAVTLQLGSGCSACAVKNGRSVETSMGISPTGGLPMATRSGDLDPGVFFTLLRQGWGVEELERLLTKGAGLEGLAGGSEMKDLQAAALTGDAQAELAIAHFVHAVVMTTGAYLTLLAGEGAVVFAGGIGTNSAFIRERIAKGLRAWDVELDPSRNRLGHMGLISTDESRPVYVFETDEESLIGRETYDLLHGGIIA